MCVFPWLPSAYKIKLTRTKFKSPGSRTFEEIRQQLSLGDSSTSTIAVRSAGSTYDINGILKLCLVTSQHSTCLSQLRIPSHSPQGSVFTHRAANNHHKNKDLKEYLVKKQSSYFSHLRTEELNSVTQAEVTPQDCYPRTEPAQLQLF